jgi:hypothetical protein
MSDLLLQERVDRALELLRQGSPPASASKRAGISERALRSYSLANPADAPVALQALSLLASEVERREREVRGAATWPFVAVVSALFSSTLVWGVALPALKRAPLGGDQLSTVPTLIAFAVAVLSLVALGLAVVMRASVPGLPRAWSSIEHHAFAACAHVLHAAGVPLPLALKSAALWLPAQGQAEGEAVAHSLEAGGSSMPSGSAALDPVALSLLFGAAKSGTSVTMLGTLSASTRVKMEREVPHDVLRLHTVSLLLAGFAVGVSFVTFYLTYVRAITG